LKSKGHLKIDLLDLYAKADTTGWNAFLSRCLRNGDLLALEKTLYGLQLGMNDLAKKKLNTEKINLWFIRLQRSLEITIKKIIKSKQPSPLDDPNNAARFATKLDEKRIRDHDIELYLKKIRF